MKRFKVNGKEYVAKELDFNAVCDLEDMGANVTQINKNSMSVVRGYIAYCGNMSPEEAGEEVQAHVLNGQNFNEIIEIIKDQMLTSDFFRSLNQTEEEGTPTNQEKAKN